MSVTTRSGAPPGEMRRPQDPAPTRTDITTASVTDRSDELSVLVDQAAALVDAINDQAERDAETDRAAFSEGYRLGFATGRDVGWRSAEYDMQRAWSALAKKVQDWAKRKSFHELEQERYPDRTHTELLLQRGRDRFPLPDRQCNVCGGRTSGGDA